MDGWTPTILAALLHDYVNSISNSGASVSGLPRIGTEIGEVEEPKVASADIDEGEIDDITIDSSLREAFQELEVEPENGLGLGLGDRLDR